jgi:hypothetical protein
MKIKYVVLLLVLFIAAQTAVYAQNTITDVDSIPLVCYLYGLNDWGENWGLEQPRYSEDEFKRIDSLRFHSVEIFDLTESQYTRDLTYGSFKFKIIPDQTTESKVGFGKNLIIKYTEAKYSVWQAEGTPPDDGEATVVANPTYTTEDNSGKFIFTKDNVQIPYGTELINGPSYVQDARYNSADTGKVDYRADFRMKLQELVPGITLVTDTVCNLQITTCLYDVVNNQWVKTDSFIIEDKPVLFGAFTELDEWLSFYVNYDLYGLPDWYYNNYSKMFINKPPNYHWDNTGRNHIQHIEFKIIWKGNSQVIRLFVDSITISDLRGRELLQTATQNLIVHMTTSPYQFSHKISGWFGLDEPHSIDNFEPIRIMNELINNYLHNKRSIAVSNEHQESQVTNQKDN